LGIQKKILVIVESIDVNKSSGSKANIALINNLNAAGFTLKVYHYDRQEIQLDGIKCISINENRKSFLFFLSRIERYLRYYLKLHFNKKVENQFGFSFTLFNDRNSIVKALKKESSFNPNWILTLSQGGSFRPHHALLKMPEFQKKWIAYIHDPYPMHWYPKPYAWREAGFKQKEVVMKQIVDECHTVAFPSQLLMEWMGSKYQPFVSKGVIIPHQIDNSPRSVKMSENYKLGNDKFTILHAGNLLQARSPFGLIEGYLNFKKSYPAINAQLILLGPAQYYEAYLNKLSELAPDIYVILENRPFKEVRELQNEVDVNVILEAIADFSPFLPGKFPHCIQANKPILILGPDKSEVKRLLGKDYPYWSTQDNPQKISDILMELYNNWKLGKDHLDREDLVNYLSEDHLMHVINSLSNK
jgi:glycosyltransferase involved in cell wall biosynthesis